MINIDYPAFKFKLKQENNKEYIFDEIRQLWVIITPEEWVRQNFISYLTQTLHYPKSLIAVEKQIKINHTIKRFDIVVYRNMQPWILIECKQPEVNLNDLVLQQVLAYKSFIDAAYIVITNGNNTFCWKMEQNNFSEESCLPAW